MGRRYSGYGSDTNTASTTQVELRSTTAIRPRIYDFIIGSNATPADNSGEYALRRTTTVGTSTAYTPVAIDPGDPAATATFGVNHSAEPTYTANSDLLHFATNQRATFRWVAAPMGEIVLPAAANGAGLLAVAIGGSAVAMQYQMYWEE
jgi:hypothetical protein